MTDLRMRAVVVAALACGVVAVAIVLTSDHEDAQTLWAQMWPVIGWTFIGTGLYAWRRRPDSRVGMLMVLQGFAWFLAALSLTDSPALYAFAQLAGGLWGGVFLHLVMTFPSGTIASRADRVIVWSGYLLFTLGELPALLFAGPHELGCDECPDNLLQVSHQPDVANALFSVLAALYFALFLVVLVRLSLRWRRTPTLERLQLTPVYVCGLLTFLLVTVATSGGGDAAWSVAIAATALLPFAFLAGLLRSHVAGLVEELRTSRARLVETADTERRRLERNLHDGAQARLVALAMLLNHTRGRAESAPDEVPKLLDEAIDELKTGLAELRELARGIHPAVLTERGLDVAIETLAARAPLPLTVESDVGERLPEPVEVAAYFAVSEALANVAKYAQATHASVTVRRSNQRVTVDVADDGIGGADPTHGSGLTGLADRVAALDGTLALDSRPGAGTRLHIELPA
jgi:signal transduction histidine kinase